MNDVARGGLLLGIGLAMTLAGARASRGDLIYQTGFEASEGFTAGGPVSGQANWLQTSGPAAGIIGTANPASGQQDLQVNGSGLEFFPSFGLYSGSYRYNTLFSGVANPRVLVEMDTRLDGAQTFPPISGDLISADFVLSDIAGMEISSDGHVYADDENNNFYQFGTAVTLGEYHRLGILLDFASAQESFYVDGSFLGTLAMPSGGPTSFYTYAALIGLPDADSYAHGDYTSYFDNLSVRSVPEPSSLLLIGVGGLRPASYGRRRSRTRRADPDAAGANRRRFCLSRNPLLAQSTFYGRS